MLFAGVGILIACIGLFGLATLVAASRIKEIGIRKVLGASAVKMVTLLLFDFNKLILVAVLLAVPITIWMMGDWLDTFAYRISLSDTWTSLLMGSLLTLIVSWLTVSYHSIKAAVSNPVKNLRTE